MLNFKINDPDVFKYIKTKSILIISLVALLIGCGGGGSDSTSSHVPTASEVAAITPSQVANYSDAQVIALGSNIKYLSNLTLNALSSSTGPTNGPNSVGQIESITAAQIATFTPAQVRMIGAAGPGGSVTTSQIARLNSGAWAALVSDTTQVAAITAAEIGTLFDGEITAMGNAIAFLSNGALNALSSATNGAHPVGQIESITAAQIATFTPAQVRMIGAAGPGGSVTTSQIARLNSGAWAALVSDTTQVAAITAAEIGTLFDGEITAMGTNFSMLTDAALSALSYFTGGAHPAGQIESISAAQIGSLTPAQISVIAGINADKGISFLNTGSFQSLTPSQIAILTSNQKSFFSTTQHSVCGC